MPDYAQLLKGTLEGCILKLISNEPTYGYQLAEQINAYPFVNITEGTLYPMLLRLERRKLISASFRPSPNGPSRKYYTLTEEGVIYLEEFCKAWNNVAKMTDSILGGNDEESV